MTGKILKHSKSQKSIGSSIYLMNSHSTVSYHAILLLK